ncbi:uncharacterized protein LOC119766714 [Culex quinquefasciatus]|uniref:uncharacterized protein LOC119766714 n=1 Tax=Culex quinquefasciatus TaxID=7176 RepID=UPI00016D74DB|nr:uncharacterized protein LOC119766714 [Culex quinquefasciatus]
MDADICPELVPLTSGLSLAEHQPSPADLLPPELWELIFRYLSAAELLPVRLTSHRWKDIVTNSPTLLEKFTVTLEGIFFDDLSRVIPASKLYIRSCRIDRLVSWHETAHRLSCLTLDSCELTLPTLVAMLAQTPNLKRLRLDEVDVFSSGCEIVVNFRLDRLEKLVVEWVCCDGILDVFEGRCHRLKTFKIFGNQKESNIVRFMKTVQDSLEYIKLSPNGGLLEEISNLKHLKLKRIQFGKGSFDQGQLVEFCRRNHAIENVCVHNLRLSTQTLEQIGLQLPTLKRLRVTIAENGTIVLTFLRSMKHLEYLCLYGGYRTEQSLDFTGCECPKLVQLQTYDLPLVQRGLRQFFEKSSNIWYLTLDGSVFDSWPDVFTALEPLECLYELVLSHVKIRDDGDLEGEKCLVHRKNSSLNGLVLSHCKIAKDLLIRQICRCTELEELWLTAIDSVDEAVVLALLGNLTKLKMLTISDCGEESVTSKVLNECKARGISINN